MNATDATMSAAPAANALKVFLVEDSVPIRNILIEEIVAIDGLALVGFADSQAGALLRLAVIDWDVVIVDIKLREGTGIDLLRDLQHIALPAHPYHKIIFTNFTDRGYRQRGAEYGAQHFFDKRDEFPQLLQLLTTLAHGVAA
jgi:DNA-binding NarL/FixJ family response regulator